MQSAPARLDNGLRWNTDSQVQKTGSQGQYACLQASPRGDWTLTLIDRQPRTQPQVTSAATGAVVC